MAKYIIASTRLNDDGTIHSVSHPIEVDSDTINTIKILDKTYILEKHGRWIDAGDSKLHCTSCHRYIRRIVPIGYDYCPYCGARMDGEENEAD